MSIIRGFLAYWGIGLIISFLGIQPYAKATDTPQLPCEILLAGGDLAKQRFFTTLFHQGNVALFPSGSAAAMATYEAQLRELDIDVVMLSEPTQDDIAQVHGQGFLVTPKVVTWHQPALSYEAAIRQRQQLASDHPAFLKGTDAYKRIYNWKSKLGLADGRTVLNDTNVPVEILPLTEANFKMYYDELFIPHVVRAKGEKGQDVLGSDFASETSKRRQGVSLDNFRIAVWKLPGEATPFAGILIEKFPEHGVLKIRSASYNKELSDPRTKSGYTRARDLVAELAIAEGIATISYGSDPNFFGEIGSQPGLLSIKATMGFSPVVWEGAPPLFGVDNFFAKTQIIKILRPDRMGRIGTDGAYALFAFTDPMDPTQGLSLAMRGDLALPASGERRQEQLVFPKSTPIIKID